MGGRRAMGGGAGSHDAAAAFAASCRKEGRTNPVACHPCPKPGRLVLHPLHLQDHCEGFVASAAQKNNQRVLMPQETTSIRYWTTWRWSSSAAMRRGVWPHHLPALSASCATPCSCNHVVGGMHTQGRFSSEQTGRRTQHLHEVLDDGQVALSHGQGEGCLPDVRACRECRVHDTLLLQAGHRGSCKAVLGRKKQVGGAAAQRRLGRRASQGCRVHLSGKGNQCTSMRYLTTGRWPSPAAMERGVSPRRGPVLTGSCLAPRCCRGVGFARRCRKSASRKRATRFATEAQHGAERTSMRVWATTRSPRRAATWRALCPA